MLSIWACDVRTKLAATIEQWTNKDVQDFCKKKKNKFLLGIDIFLLNILFYLFRCIVYIYIYIYMYVCMCVCVCVCVWVACVLMYNVTLVV